MTPEVIAYLSTLARCLSVLALLAMGALVSMRREQ